MAQKQVISPNSRFLKETSLTIDPKINHCYQCKKCTNGCPLTFAMDIMPNQVMRLIALGQKEEVLKSKTIWICASCQICTTRCPNDINIAHVMDGLRRLCRAEGIRPAEEAVSKFHDAFLAAIKSRGRMNELEMILRYKLKTHDFMGDLKLGMKMFLKGRIKLLGHKVRGLHEIKRIFDRYKA
jgi:heterodisulfide reductase subunit C